MSQKLFTLKLFCYEAIYWDVVQNSEGMTTAEQFYSLAA